MRLKPLRPTIRKIFGDNFYLELQRHNAPFDEKLNEQTIALAEKFSIELVATNNVHYLERKDAGCYRAMVANRTKEKLSNPASAGTCRKRPLSEVF